MRTKRAKTFTSWIFPVGDDIEAIFVEWFIYLQKERGFGPEDPLFPKTKVAPGDDLEFQAIGLEPAHWSNANPVREIFRDACATAGLPYFNPHTFRNTLVQLAYELKLDPEAFKAWSQNLGHDSCLTTFSSYGEIRPGRQGEIMRNLARPRSEAADLMPPEVLRWINTQAKRGGG